MPDIDYRKLLGRMRERGMSQVKLAEILCITANSLWMKLNGKTPFKQKEINEIVEVLEIPVSEIGLYFFTKKVEETPLSE